MLTRTADLEFRIMSLSKPEIRYPEEYDAPLEWRAPSERMLAAVRHVVVIGEVVE
jgi:hypothetical protein